MAKFLCHATVIVNHVPRKKPLQKRKKELWYTKFGFGVILLANTKHLSVGLITDITFIQARQAISDEPKASQILS